MNLYCLTFSACGQLTRIPDAQTIFGALCTAIRMKDGQQKLEDYLASFEEKPWFVHSSMFPKGLFPAAASPLISLKELHDSVLSQVTQNRLPILESIKSTKKYSYMSSSVFQDYYLKGRTEKLRIDLQNSRIKISDQNGVSVLCKSTETRMDPFLIRRILQTRSGTLSNKVEKDLFYQEQIFPSKESRFCIYVKSDWKPAQLRPYFALLEYVGIGPHRSTGLNLFRLESIEKSSLHSDAGKEYLLSGCIPWMDDFDFEHSEYRIDSALFRGSYSIVRDALTGSFAKLKEGSLMVPVKKKEWYGRLIRMEVNGQTIYHYGLGVTV